MTCVAAVVHDGHVYMAADSAADYGGTVVMLGVPKVVRRGEFVLGFSGSVRVAGLVRNTFEPPPVPPGADLAAYMAGAFCDALYRLVDAHSAFEVDKETGRKCLGGALLVGVRGRIFMADEQFGCPPVAGSYFAIGSGADLALGTLYAQVESRVDGHRSCQPIPALLTAVKAAIRFSSTCGGDIHNVSTREEGA
jgi:ATP-dependent protease HslVU (ClpYQ) peptidase subunit